VIQETIRQQSAVLEALDAGDSQKLVKHLREKADALSANPSWIIGRSPELLKFPDKLRELAKAIGN
jgi:hypothetical protein